MTARTVAGRLDELAHEQPDALAIDGPGGPVTFAALRTASSTLATILAGRLAGTQGARAVAVLVGPDHGRQVGAVAAVLYAGHTALVISPRAPGALQREWVRAAGVGILLADQAHGANAKRRFGVPVVIDDDLRGEPTGALRQASADDPALLVPRPHTPDGIVLGSLTHGDLVDRAAADAEAVGLHPGDRLATPLPLSSPQGARAMIMSLLAGATLVLRDPEHEDPEPLSSWLERRAVSVLALSPTLIEVANAEPPFPVPELRRLLVLSPGTAADRAPLGLDAAPNAALVTVGEWAPTNRAQTIPTLPEPTEALLVTLWEELLGVHPVGLHDDFFDLGGYSLLAARLLVRLEQQTGTRLPMAVFLEATTIAELATAVRRSGRSTTHPAIARIQPGDPGLAPLFITHDLQGSAFRFRDLARATGDHRPVYGFESPMLEGRLEFTTIEALAGHYVDALRTVQAHGPYHLCGYSFGGVLAFEMARILRRDGHEVALLGVIDVGPGYRGLDYSRTAHPPLPYLQDAIHGPSSVLPTWARPVRRLWLNRWLLARRWRRMLSRGETVPPDQRLWFAWWAHWNLVGPAWSASPYDGRIDLFWAATTAGTDATMGWGSYASEVVVHRVGGKHEQLMTAPTVEVIGHGLRQRLDAAHSPMVPGV